MIGEICYKCAFFINSKSMAGDELQCILDIPDRIGVDKYGCNYFRPKGTPKDELIRVANKELDDFEEGWQRALRPSPLAFWKWRRYSKALKTLRRTHNNFREIRQQIIEEEL